MAIRNALLSCLVFAVASLCGCGKPKVSFITIGTGGMSGVYYPTGGNIAKMVNAKRDQYGLKCSHESTGGSVFNVNALLSGDLDFGIVQSDRQYQAIRGLAEWAEKGPQKNLRAVFAIYTELVTLAAADDAGINSLADLKGKHVNIGNPGSGTRQNAIDAIEAAGINYETDLTAEQLKAAEAPGYLQDDRIDAFFYTVGHPSGAFKEATSGKRKIHFVPITGIESLLRETPYYVNATIPKKYYPAASGDADIPTFGVKATFMTTASVADDVVYAVTKEVFENLDSFKALHPAYGEVTKESMLDGLSATFHPGAVKYYREAGLL